MSDSEKKDILFLQLAVLLKMQEERKRKKRVRELFRKQEEKGAFNNLIQEMKLADRESPWPLLALTIFAKRSMFVSWQGSENASVNGFRKIRKGNLCTFQKCYF